MTINIDRTLCAPIVTAKCDAHDTRERATTTAPVLVVIIRRVYIIIDIIDTKTNLT